MFKKSVLFRVLVFVALALGFSAPMHAAPVLATIDLTGVTGGLTDLGTAVVTGAAVVITAALGVGAVFFGGKSLWRFFKGLAH